MTRFLQIKTKLTADRQANQIDFFSGEIDYIISNLAGSIWKDCSRRNSVKSKIFTRGKDIQIDLYFSACSGVILDVCTIFTEI